MNYAGYKCLIPNRFITKNGFIRYINLSDNQKLKIKKDDDVKIVTIAEMKAGKQMTKEILFDFVCKECGKIQTPSKEGENFNEYEPKCIFCGGEIRIEFTKKGTIKWQINKMGKIIKRKE